MEYVRIDVGVDTILEVDLSQINFDGVKEVVFTVKNTPDIKAEPIIERKFTEAKIHEIKISAEESVRVRDNAEYDFQKTLDDGTRIKITDNGKIKLRYSVGDKID